MKYAFSSLSHSDFFFLTRSHSAVAHESHLCTSDGYSFLSQCASPALCLTGEYQDSNGECHACHATCLKCTGPQSEDCISCISSQWAGLDCFRLSACHCFSIIHDDDIYMYIFTYMYKHTHQTWEDYLLLFFVMCHCKLTNSGFRQPSQTTDVLHPSCPLGAKYK